MRKILTFFVIFILGFQTSAQALNLSRVKTWGTEVLTAADLNAEFDNIINHTINNADIGASAAIVGSKLDLSVPGAIGGTTPGAGAFSTLSSSGLATLASATVTGNLTGSNLTASKPVFTDASKILVSTGTLGADQGGTGLTSITDGFVMLGSGAGAVTPLDVTADGEIIIGDGTTDPTTLEAFSSATGTLKKAYGGTGTTGDAVVKGWASVTYSGATPTLNDSFNVSGITDTGTGKLTVTWDTDFGSVNYCPVATLFHNPGTSVLIFTIEIVAAGSVQLDSFGAGGGLVDPDGGMFCMATGDQ